MFQLYHVRLILGNKSYALMRLVSWTDRHTCYYTYTTKYIVTQNDVTVRVHMVRYILYTQRKHKLRK